MQSKTGAGNSDRWSGGADFARKGKAGTGAFWTGLPVKLTFWDPLSTEFGINCGSAGGAGKGAIARSDGLGKSRNGTRREGWLAKALVECRMAWGVPGLFGWYGSGGGSNP